MLEWRQVEEGKVDHVVLGRGKPGGIWQVNIGWHMQLCIRANAMWTNGHMGIWAKACDI